MTEQDVKMWNIIGAMGWIESGCNFKSVESFLLSNYNDDEIKSLSIFVDNRLVDLANRIDQFEDETGCSHLGYGGDEGFGDMIAHIVGMGKLTFDAVMENPRLIHHIEPTASFLFTIPDDVDFAREVRTLGYHQIQASNCLDELLRITSDNDPDTPEQDVILELTGRMLHLALGRVTHACFGLTDRTSSEWRRTYTRFSQWPNECAINANTRPGSSYGEANDRHALFANVLSDAAEMLIN